jgi:hypothetical protein
MVQSSLIHEQSTFMGKVSIKFPSLLETFALGPTSYHVWLDFCYLIFVFNFMNQVFQMPIKRRKISSALLNSNKFV